MHGANVQPGQVVAIGATVGQEALARAIADAAYRRGALFVDVAYFDPYVKRARIEHADPETLEFVPPWYGNRVDRSAERGDARIGFAGVVDPHALDGLDPALLGRDQLPWLKETSQVISERATNWTIVPCPHREWAQARLPRALRGRGLRAALGRALAHPPARRAATRPLPGTSASRAAGARREALTERRFDAARAARARHRARRSACCRPSAGSAGDFTTRNGLRHLPNLPTEEVFTTPDPVADRGPRHLDEAARAEGRHDRPRPAACASRAAARSRSTPTRTRGAIRARTGVDEGAARLGELALVDRQGRIGPLGTVFYDTLLDENAASHIALGFGFPFAVERGATSTASTTSEIHIDFMIGSPELEVTGVTAERRARARPARRRLADLARRPRGDRDGRRRSARPTAGSHRGRARLSCTATSGEPAAPCSTRTPSAREEGVLADGGPLVVDTGRHTGRSPKDKFVVREPGVGGPHLVGQGQPAARARSTTTALREKVAAYLGERDLYVVDAFAGADPAHRIALRVVTDQRLPRALRADDVHHAGRRRSSSASSREARRPARARLRGRPGATTARAPARSSRSTRRGRRC